MASVTATLEFYNGSTWADITPDMIAGSLEWSGGIRRGGPTDRVALPGRMTVELKNGQNSSGGLGYYSPDHANKRTGWVIGAKIRVKLVSGANTRYWLYRVKEIKPVPGQYGQRRVDVTASDYMEELSVRKVSGLAIQTNSRGNDLLTTLLASMPIAPTVTSFDAGAFQFPYSFHDEKDEETACLTVAQKISQSELSYIYCDGDATGGETLHYESHTTRMNNVTAAGTLSDTMQDLSIEHSREDIYNKIKSVVSPVEVDTAVSVLGSVSEAVQLEPSEEKIIYLRYTDEATTRRISAIGVISPVADTDYKMSSVAGVDGNDLNANLTLAAIVGANTLSVTLENTAAVKGYVLPLQVRGQKVTLYDKIESVAKDDTSIAAYGERTLTYNMPYQNNASFGQAVANEVLRRFKDPSSNISGVSFVANRSDTLMGYTLTLGIGSRVSIFETVTGVNSHFYINGYEYELRAGNSLSVTWMLERAFNSTRYFTVGDTAYGVIGGAYNIAPF